MNFTDKLISTIAPHDCLGCGYEGQLLCAACAGSISAAPKRCYRCNKALPGAAMCQDCRSISSLDRAQAATPYAELAKELVWRLKFHGTQAAAQVMARHMAALVTDAQTDVRTDARAFSAGPAMLVPVPTATSRMRSRGYDQAKLLARELSRQTGLSYIDCLRRRGQTHQVGSFRTQRLEQLREAFWVKCPASLLALNSTIILVDDVLTTGATLETAAMTLKQAGAHSVDAVVFAQA